jgi:kynurenine formamidase
MRLILRAMIAAIGVACAASCSGAASDARQSAAEPRVVDLGHALADTDPTWTGEKVFSRTVVATFAKDGYAAGSISTEEHFGTHVDAPAHFAADGLTVDRLPADKLVRPAVCLHIEPKVAADEDYRLTTADIQAFEREHGAIPAQSIVLVATGWDRRWPDQAKYMNVRAGVKHFPGLSVEATQLLARDRHVAAIGIDTGSIDYGPSEQFEAHKTSMPLGVYHIENAANLGDLPATGFTVVVAPIKIKDGSGGPTRVFALLPR